MVGARLYEQLSRRGDLEFLLIDPEKRRDVEERRKLLNGGGPGYPVPARGGRRPRRWSWWRTPIPASLIPRPPTEPHRWVYGFAELLPGQRQRIRFSKRVSNPGCHASGFLSTVAPLVQMGILPPDYPVSCFSITGYSGGGKDMIAEYEDLTGTRLWPHRPRRRKSRLPSRRARHPGRCGGNTPDRLHLRTGPVPDHDALRAAGDAYRLPSDTAGGYDPVIGSRRH